MTSYVDLVTRNCKESLFIIDSIEKNNSIIHQDRVIKEFNNFPFAESGNSITLSHEVYEYVKRQELIEGYDLMISIFALINKYENKIYHLLSRNVINDTYYINLQLLESIENFNEYYLNELATMKVSDINTIIENIFIGFKFSLSSINTSKYSIKEFKTGNIITKINLLKELLGYLCISNKIHYDLSSKYYIFYSSDFKLFRNIKSDLKEIYSSSVAASTYFYLKNKLNSENDIITLPKMPIIFKQVTTSSNNDNLYFLGSTKLTESQLNAISNIKYPFHTIVGLAGSGKTHIASILVKKYLFLNAVYLANKKRPLPVLYASYTTLSNRSFINEIDKFKRLVLYTNMDERDNIFEMIIDNRLDSFKNCDIEKLKAIENKLKKFSNVANAIETFERYVDKCRNIMKTLTEEEKNAIKKLGVKVNNFIKNKPDENLITLLRSLIIKEPEKKFVIDDEYINLLSKHIILKKEYSFNEAIELKNTLLTLYRKKDSVITIPHYESIELTDEDIDYLSDEELEYYCTYRFMLEEEKVRNTYINVFGYIASFKKSKEGDAKLYEDIIEKIGKNEYEQILKELFPITVSLITDLRNFINLDYRYYTAIIDESLMVPSYFTYSILSRTNSVILLGDVSQMNFTHLYPMMGLKEKLLNFYNNNEELFIKYNLFLNKKEDVNSFFDVININETLSNDENLSILIDNFRSTEDIVRALIILSRTYFDYVIRYLNRQKDKKTSPITLNNEDGIMSYIKLFRTEKKVFVLDDGSITDKSILGYNTVSFKDRENIYRALFKFINEQKSLIRKKVMIVSPFKMSVKEIRNIVDNILPDYSGSEKIESVFCGTVDNIQGLEYDIVIFDSGIENEYDEALRYIGTVPQILSVSISRARDMFIFVGNLSVLYSSLKTSKISNFVQRVKFEKINLES